MKRAHWQRRIAELDPETDYEQISRIMGTYEFPWDSQQALSFALFRTYAVPSIGRLLFDTGEFTLDTQRRHDDTALILETIAVEGMESDDGRAAVRRMNQMHASYDISNDDLRYVLATFVVTPTRWIERYGWRRGTAAERLAVVRYHQRLGRLMGIKDIPADYEAFVTLMDDYECEHFAFDPKSRAVADVTMELFATFYPRPVRPVIRVASRALLDDHLREAFGYPRPSRLVSALTHGSLRLRGRLLGLLPARRRPSYFRDLKKIRSYPGGFMIEKLGTFPATGADLRDGSTVA